MPELILKPEYLSQALWTMCLETHEAELTAVREDIAHVFAQTRKLQDQMEHPTGTVSFSSAIALYLLTRWVKPRTVFEIGTFIGTSCLTIAKAMEVNGRGGRIVTCDGSNAFRVPTDLSSIPISGYGTTMSTQALKDVAANDTKVDLFHFDGRLDPEDYDLLAALSHDDTVIALDDSDNIEKGVMNAMGLLSRPHWNKRYVLVTPPQGRPLDQMVPNAHRCLTSVLLPIKFIRLYIAGFAEPVF